MNRTALMRFALGAAVLMVVILALTACGIGSAQEEPKARPLPLYENALSPGEYHSVKFKPPLSFKVGKGWSNTAQQLSDYIELGQQGEIGFLTFANVKEVWKPGTMNVVDAPKDLVEWLQQHPYLETSKPEPVTLGGVKGLQFDVVVGDRPQYYIPICTSIVGTPNCVDLFRLSTGEPIFLFEGDKAGVIVLEDVEGETVTIGFVSPASEFGELAPRAQKVLESVEWRGS